jgi:ABC-2 type transport system ATP-binding protein
MVGQGQAGEKTPKATQNRRGGQCSFSAISERSPDSKASEGERAMATTQSGGEPMIQVDHVTKLYGEIRAVDDLTFSVGRGEILGFLGPNGAGKTTTMRMLTCYTPPTSGTASVGGCDVRMDSIGVRRQIGYLPDLSSVQLYHDMKVRSYLHFMAEIKKCPAARRRAMVDAVIDECRLADVADRLVGNLSKGFRQRVGLAQALLGDPQVLILDEPTDGMDPAQKQEVHKMIKAMAGRRTVILSTHILPEVTVTCQKVVIINRGRMGAAGALEELGAQFEEDKMIMATVEGDADKAESLLRGVPGVKRVTLDARLSERAARFLVEPQHGADPRADLARAVTGGGLGLTELQSSGLTLETIYMRVTQREVA